VGPMEYVTEKRNLSVEVGDDPSRYCPQPECRTSQSYLTSASSAGRKLEVR
jgi:hypothetical protein